MPFIQEILAKDRWTGWVLFKITRESPSGPTTIQTWLADDKLATAVRTIERSPFKYQSEVDAIRHAVISSIQELQET